MKILEKDSSDDSSSDSDIAPGHYVVEKIVDKKLFGKIPKYYVKWMNYSSNENTW